MLILCVLIILLCSDIQGHYSIVAVSDGICRNEVARLNFIGHSGHFVHRRAVRRERRRGYARKQGEHSLLEAVARSVVNALYRHKLRGVYALCVRSSRLVISEHLRGIGGVEPAVNIYRLGLCRAGGAGLRRGSWADGSRLARCALSLRFCRLGHGARVYRYRRLLG